MKLHWSPRSPFVRKVVIAAREKGLVDRLTFERNVVAMTAPNPTVMRDNPLSKLPTLVLDDGRSLYDSRVIIEYFDDIGFGPRLCPQSGDERLEVLRRQALADGLLDTILLWRNERLKPASAQVDKLLHAFATKTDAALDQLNREVSADKSSDFDVADIALFCTLAHLDFRLPDIDWRSGRDALANWYLHMSKRPSVMATPISDDESRPVSQQGAP